MAAYLIDRGADINSVTEKNANALGVAAWNGHKEVVALLLSKGIFGINSPSTDGSTPLHYAAHKGHSGIAEILMQNNAKVRNTKIQKLTKTKG